MNLHTFHDACSHQCNQYVTLVAVEVALEVALCYDVTVVALFCFITTTHVEVGDAGVFVCYVAWVVMAAVLTLCTLI